MWSSALDAILTTLRYLAPATLITLFWGQQSFLFRILKHIDLAIRTIVYSSNEQKESVLKWLSEVGPVKVEDLDTVWRHGWIMCGVMDTYVPGACAGHPPTSLSLKHAQTIADHYLGVDPVFSRQELESNDSLSKHQEWRLAQYIERVREALTKIPLAVSKPSSQRTSPENIQYTSDYVARGSGLSAAQINNQSFFKIYPSAQQSLEPGEVTVLIRGPKDTYGMIVIPPIFGKAQLLRQKVLSLQSTPRFTENVLPVTQGATYLRAYGRNDMNKTYFIPKTDYDIKIEVELQPEYAKVGYTTNLEGKYEISIVSRGQCIVGSPFTVKSSRNILGVLENDSFCLEDGEEIDMIDDKTDRKVVLRIVDFVSEKMLLNENGTLEKVTEDEAKKLMTTNNIQNKKENYDNCRYKSPILEAKIQRREHVKFKETVSKLTTVLRICRRFNEILKEKNTNSRILEKENYLRPESRLGIPDVVNSTFCEFYESNTYGSRDRVLKCKDVSLSILSETTRISKDNTTDKTVTNESDALEIERRNLERTNRKVISTTNPFLNNLQKQELAISSLGNFAVEKDADKDDVPIKILVDEDGTTTSSNTNPFVETELVNLERPKTPVLKIITGEIQNREDSVYVDPNIEKITEEFINSNEFLNPFFIHQHYQTKDCETKDPVIDFIIGAPVSLPPMLKAPSPEPNLNYIIMTPNNQSLYSSHIDKFNGKSVIKEDIDFVQSAFSKPLNHKSGEISNITSTIHSMESNQYNSTLNNNNSCNQYKIELNETDKETVKTKKDMWDSAYVSIDDNNTSPDSNNNENLSTCEISNKAKIFSSDSIVLKPEDISKMGPAEKEIWESCNELGNGVYKLTEEIKPVKWDVKRSIFTPIIEESDRSISAGMKDSVGMSKLSDSDSVTVAFAELNDIFQEYKSNSECSSITTCDDDNIGLTTELEYPSNKNDIRVESASGNLTDVMRPTKNYYGGMISGVQPSVTESVSVSQTLLSNLQAHNDYLETYNKNETHFGDGKQRNIVLERKKYWDDRIRLIEEKKSEQPIKKKLITKNLRHNDSLTRRKGKQIIKNIMATTDVKESKASSEIIETKITIQAKKQDTEEIKNELELVPKWKKHWNEKLDKDAENQNYSNLKTKMNKTSSLQWITQNNDNVNTLDERCFEVIKPKSSSLPVKQELSEEVFKAFETSPKRFFGTSRKQILNKIDAYLVHPGIYYKTLKEASDETYEKGIVTSRINLFHNISKVEELPWARAKSRSLHNIRINTEPVTVTLDTQSITEGKQNINNHISKPSKEVLNNKIKLTSIENTVDKEISLQKLLERNIAMELNSSVKTDVKNIGKDTVTQNNSIKNIINDISKVTEKEAEINKTNNLRKASLSKSEMDIFNKIGNTKAKNGLDKYNSCDELPKINVKNFINLYENVSKSSRSELKQSRNKMSRTGSIGSEKNVSMTSTSESFSKYQSRIESTNSVEKLSNCNSPTAPPRRKRWAHSKSKENIAIAHSSENIYSTKKKLNNTNQDNRLYEEPDYISLSDIELEIVESPERLIQSSNEETVEVDPKDYKLRFNKAKQFFQSLEELRADVKKPLKQNECEELLYNQLNESQVNRPKKRVKKNIKSHSMDSSEISVIWNQMQDVSNEGSSSKLVKISEKFNIDDLFSDVMEGKLSRQGSLRGIPHKKAVLETFKSMENISNSKLSSYEIAVSQLTEFAKENKIKNAQTYLTEYPYLPTTDPSKYHSRLDVKASGLISMKELLNSKPRRNSFPDMRLNMKFTVDL